ncbi:cysteine hydrolase family protein [Eilatimonas milleporae]|uniref:Nicotinamidase-related amidase n=1 Tax=Eilatimonas milleporae TaxID=911205 RepID=A0A3M0C9E9_9PROT|nr:cysteine hydrolase family protein [Eilatimonas milleporae]RMB04980.1 nicotinamidase-related amidase [Eilatimonas milleporae]
MKKQALIVIDLQNDYYPSGKWPLHNIGTVTFNAVTLLWAAREAGDPVIHVYHEFATENPPFFAPDTHGAQIHPSGAPQDGEWAVLKTEVNAFHKTELKALLDTDDITDVTIIGAMSHMCIDSAARSASDYGFNVTVVADACASRDLVFQDMTIPAQEVHNAYMSALEFAFAKVTTTERYLKARMFPCLNGGSL